ncbi:MAG: DinB family protein [Dehalococcoidia bacterium]
MNPPPEFAVFAGRAARAREELTGLLDVVPDGEWIRQASGDAWDIHTHVAHVAAADAAATDLFRALPSSPGMVLMAETLTHFAEARAAAIADARTNTPGALRTVLVARREEALRALSALPYAAFDASLVLPGGGAWGQDLTLSVRSYLATWAAHDLEHAAAIRAALLVAPSPSAMALAARLRRR